MSPTFIKLRKQKKMPIYYGTLNIQASTLLFQSKTMFPEFSTMLKILLLPATDHNSNFKLFVEIRKHFKFTHTKGFWAMRIYSHTRMNVHFIIK